MQIGIFAAREKQSTDGRKVKTPTLPKQRVGHPEKPSQFLGVDVLEWYDSIVIIRDQKNAKGSATRAKGLATRQFLKTLYAKIRIH
jgi:hypothetical protein